jgi:hypothetical protein
MMFVQRRWHCYELRESQNAPLFHARSGLQGCISTNFA